MTLFHKLQNCFLCHFLFSDSSSTSTAHYFAWSWGTFLDGLNGLCWIKNGITLRYSSRELDVNRKIAIKTTHHYCFDHWWAKSVQSCSPVVTIAVPAFMPLLKFDYCILLPSFCAQAEQGGGIHFTHRNTAQQVWGETCTKSYQIFLLQIFLVVKLSKEN